MTQEHYQPIHSGTEQPEPTTPLFREVLSDIEIRRIDEAAQALARGEVVVMRLYTLGLLVDGTNEEALQKLFEAKYIPYERAKRGERPIVSILPAPQYREGLIAVERHHEAIQPLLSGDDHHMLTPEGHSLFYRVHVAEQEHLRVPLISQEPTGERAMVLLWHDNPYVRLLEAQTRVYKGGDILLTGSSANPTGQPQPTFVQDLHPSILSRVATIVDLQDARINSVSTQARSAIPIINLVGHPPSIMRSGNMYDPLPAHPTLQTLLTSRPDIQASAAA